MNCLEVRSIEPGSALLGFEEILMFHNLLETINVCNICSLGRKEVTQIFHTLLDVCECIV